MKRPLRGYALQPLFEDGKVWEYSGENFCYIDSVCGDVEFEGRICKLLQKRCDLCHASHDVIVYEENGRSYFYSYSGFFSPIMDFNLKEDDFAEFLLADDLNVLDRVEVTKVDTVNIRGVDRLRISGSCFEWIEGIGATEIMTQFPMVAASPEFKASGSHVECRKDGKVLCTGEDFRFMLLVFYCPCGVESAVVEQDDNGPTFDIMGRRVDELQPGNLYIRNSRKFIAR